MAAPDALRTIAAFRLALPRTILRFAGGREITLGDLGTRDGLLGGVNAVIVGNYLTTLGRPAEDDLALLDELAHAGEGPERRAVGCRAMGQDVGTQDLGTTERIEGHGGDLAVAAARAHGVETMFTLSGAHVFPLYDGAVKAAPADADRRRPARGRPRCSPPRPRRS